MQFGEAVQVRGVDLTISRVNELELFMLSSFIRKLAEAAVTPEMWYSVATLLSSVSPEVMDGDDPLVEIDPYAKTGRVNFTGEEFNQFFAAVYEAWKAANSGKESVTIAESSDKTETDLSIVAEMKERIAILEATAKEGSVEK